jgi:hypothetical protein
MKQIKPTQAYINQDRAQALLEKWAPVLNYSSKNVSAIEDDHTRLNTAMLLENQESWCLNEAGIYAGGSNSVFGFNGINGGLGNGATGGGNASLAPAGDNYATGDNRLPKILIPMTNLMTTKPNAQFDFKTAELAISSSLSNNYQQFIEDIREWINLWDQEEDDNTLYHIERISKGLIV